jgi:hypothetical protein
MKDSQHRRPIAFGLFAASVAPVVWLMLRESHWPQPPDFDLTVLRVWYLSSLACTLFLGLPLVMLLKFLSRLTWPNVLVGAAVAGYFFVQLMIYAMLGELRSDRLLDPHIFMDGASLGLAAGIGFCIATWPNNSFKPRPLRGSA